MDLLMGWFNAGSLPRNLQGLAKVARSFEMGSIGERRLNVKVCEPALFRDHPVFIEARQKGAAIESDGPLKCLSTLGCAGSVRCQMHCLLEFNDIGRDGGGVESNRGVGGHQYTAGSKPR